MHILVANPTLTNVDFNYRISGHEKVFTQSIPAGEQARLAVDMDDDQILEVITQLERFGGVDESDIKSLKTPHSLVFSIRKPVTTSQIDEARERDLVNRQTVSDEEAQKAGMVVAKSTIGKLIKSTTEVIQMENTSTDRPATGGVDMRVTVAQDAGALEVKRG